MRGWRGFLGAIFGLSVLYSVLQPGAPERVGGLLGDISKLIEKGFARISDPKLGGLRDYRQAPTSGPAAARAAGFAGGKIPNAVSRKGQTGKVRPQ